MNNKEYDKLVKRLSPKTNIVKTVFFAFIFGGVICTVGEVVRCFFLKLNLPEQTVASATSITMVFLGSFLTAIGIYDKFAKYGGCGTAVPITGFANAITSPALEYKSEGLVMGVGAKMFLIAGPVLVYGTLSSVAVGIIYYIMQFFII